MAYPLTAYFLQHKEQIKVVRRSIKFVRASTPQLNEAPALTLQCSFATCQGIGQAVVLDLWMKSKVFEIYSWKSSFIWYC